MLPSFAVEYTYLYQRILEEIVYAIRYGWWMWYSPDVTFIFKSDIYIENTVVHGSLFFDPTKRNVYSTPAKRWPDPIRPDPIRGSIRPVAFITHLLSPAPIQLKFEIACDKWAGVHIQRQLIYHKLKVRWEISIPGSSSESCDPCLEHSLEKPSWVFPCDDCVEDT